MQGIDSAIHHPDFSWSVMLWNYCLLFLSSVQNIENATVILILIFCIKSERVKYYFLLTSMQIY